MQIQTYFHYFLGADSKNDNHFGWKCMASPLQGCTKLAEILKMFENGIFRYFPKLHHIKAVNIFSQTYFHTFVDADSKNDNHVGWKFMVSPQQMSENGPLFHNTPSYESIYYNLQTYSHYFETLIPKIITILAENVLLPPNKGPQVSWNTEITGLDKNIHYLDHLRTFSVFQPTW